MDRLDYDYIGPSLRTFGRHYIDKVHKTHEFTFSGSGFEVRIRGSECTLTIRSDSKEKDARAAILVVFGDAKMRDGVRIDLETGKKEYVIARNLPFGEHRFTVYKLTEAPLGKMSLVEITTDGMFGMVKNPQEKPKRRMEFYGDSVTCGNGVLGKKGDDVFETRTEDATKSFAALTAEALNMDFSLIAVGGYPCYKTPWIQGQHINTIPEMFDLASFRWGSKRETLPKWDNSSFIPHIVVVALGANDDSYFKMLEKDKVAEEKENFIAAYVAFLNKIRLTYPRAEIVAVSGMIACEYVEPYIVEAAKKVPGVYFLKLHSLDVGGYMPNGGHPNGAMHEEAAKELTAFLRNIR